MRQHPLASLPLLYSIFCLSSSLVLWSLIHATSKVNINYFTQTIKNKFKFLCNEWRQKKCWTKPCRFFSQNLHFTLTKSCMHLFYSIDISNGKLKTWQKKILVKWTSSLVHILIMPVYRDDVKIKSLELTTLRGDIWGCIFCFLFFLHCMSEKYDYKITSEEFSFVLPVLIIMREMRRRGSSLHCQWAFY